MSVTITGRQKPTWTVTKTRAQCQRADFHKDGCQRTYFLTTTETLEGIHWAGLLQSKSPGTKMSNMTRAWVLGQKLLSTLTSSEKKCQSFLKQSKLSKNSHHDQKPYPQARPERASREPWANHTALEPKTPGNPCKASDLKMCFLFWAGKPQGRPSARQPCHAALGMDSNW